MKNAKLLISSCLIFCVLPVWAQLQGRELGKDWKQAVATAEWPRREGHSALVFEDKMWILGGGDSVEYVYRSDVWYSSDGITWTQATSSAPWGPKWGHSSVVFNNKMWILGGHNGSAYESDVWYSSDGITWTQATDSAPWGIRGRHADILWRNADLANSIYG